jgi:hypothetical protein
MPARTSSLRGLVCIAAVALLAPACDGELSGPGDAGMARADAGPRPDGGASDLDGGSTPVDATAPGTDARTPAPDTGVPEACAGGPLAAPIPDCRPARPPTTGDPVQDCVDRINQLRWECQCMPPLARWTEGEACAAMHAEYDSTRSPHSGFRDGICSPGGRGQNECPGYSSIDQTIGLCLQQMWDEGPGEPFSEHGHYLNMTNPGHGRVACGFFEAPGGRVWAIQNFAP